MAIDPNNECPDCLTVIATNHAGALAAMDYLIGLGHRRIGFIGGRPDLQCASRGCRATWMHCARPASRWIGI